MAIAMTKTTRVDAIGMVEIAAAQKGTCNTARTVCVETRVNNN